MTKQRTITWSEARCAVAVVCAYLRERGYNEKDIQTVLSNAAYTGYDDSVKHAPYLVSGFIAGVNVAGGNGRQSWQAVVSMLDRICGYEP